MNRGLFEKIVRESWPVVVICCVALGVFVALLTAVLPQLQEGLNDFLLQMPFIRTMVSAVMGIDISDGLTPTMLLAFAWSHPVVLAIVWGCEIVLCTRAPAGEIDRGTIDVLLGWPVSRRSIYVSETLAWLASGVLMLMCGFAGYFISAQWIAVEHRPETGRIVLAVVNLYCLYIAVGGCAFAVSSLSDRRGKAMAVVVGFVVCSFLLNFLGQLWTPAGHVVFLSVLHYYQPAQVLLRGSAPVGDLAVLVVFGGTMWALGGEIWVRRNVCTV